LEIGLVHAHRRAHAQLRGPGLQRNPHWASGRLNGRGGRLCPGCHRRWRCVSRLRLRLEDGRHRLRCDDARSGVSRRGWLLAWRASGSRGDTDAGRLPFLRPATAAERERHQHERARERPGAGGDSSEQVHKAVRRLLNLEAEVRSPKVARRSLRSGQVEGNAIIARLAARQVRRHIPRA
jgi:hypothetical protein